MNSRKILILSFISILSFQFFILEGFERIFYQFEELYTVYTTTAQQHGSIEKESAPCSEPQPPSEDTPFYNRDEFGYRTWGIDYDVKCGKRFLFVGSFSMGYGTGVRVDQTFSSCFYKKLRELRPDNRFEVINANSGNESITGTFNNLKDIFFTKIKPDVVVFGAYTADRGRYARRKGETLEERVFGNVSKTAEGSIDVKKNGMLINTKLSHSNIWYELYSRSFLMGKLLAYTDIKTSEIIESTNEFFDKKKEIPDDYGFIYDLVEYLYSHDIAFGVVELPFKTGGERGEVRNDMMRKLKAVCEELNVPFLSTTELHPDYTWPTVSRGHYSIESNKVIGSDIAEWLHKILDDHFRLKESG